MLKQNKKVFCEGLLKMFKNPQLKVRTSTSISNEEIIQMHLYGLIVWARQYVLGYPNMLYKMPFYLDIDKRALKESHFKNFEAERGNIHHTNTEDWKKGVDFFKNNTLERLACSYLIELNIPFEIRTQSDEDTSWSIIVDGATFKKYIDKYW